ncbi:camp-mediated signaling sok1 protein [Rutstroemia sp. NJR-2017a BBW]|nr:camp-mediated signaling sok1 protein [Rutstroemia sp. NJR-2017a BBW]
MVVQLSNASRNWDIGMLVAGIRNLLGVLEAMKLDTANHQIRYFRPFLIADTVQFEQKFFMKKIAIDKVDIDGAHEWFRRAGSLPDIIPLQGSVYLQGKIWDFMKAFVNLTLPSRASEPAPYTFLFDEERLVKLRSDILDLINLEISMYMYHNLEAIYKSNKSRSVLQDDTLATSLSISTPTDEDVLSVPTAPSQNDQSFSQQIWIPEDEKMDSASPRSSPSTTLFTSETYLPTPLYLSPQDSNSSSQARTSLQALLASSSSHNKWEDMSSNISLQILRTTSTPMNRLPILEKYLILYLSNSNSKVYLEAEADFLAKLLPELQRLVKKYTSLTGQQIFEAATSSNPVLGPIDRIAQLNVQKDNLLDIATRIAHIGILHWRVWAPLVYLYDKSTTEEEKDASMS